MKNNQTKQPIKSKQTNKEYYSNYETSRNFPPLTENDLEMYEDYYEDEEDNLQ